LQQRLSYRRWQQRRLAAAAMVMAVTEGGMHHDLGERRGELPSVASAFVT